MSRIFRLFRILTIAAQFGLLQQLLDQYLLPGWISRRGSKRSFSEPLAVRIRLFLEALGPIFVKFGQMISTRKDMLSEAFAVELAKLQDQVAPLHTDQVIAILNEAYDGNIDAVFSEFSMNCVASASIAQVHSATLIGGERVAVKILRPNMKKTIEDDLALLDTVAWIIEWIWADASRIQPRSVVSEFAKALRSEQDLRREAGNASLLRKNFSDGRELLVPEIYWDHCRSNVLVMSWMSGLPIAPVERLKEAGVDVHCLAELGVKIFFKQVFRDGFFHADMHPGNILITPDGRYIALDFGIVGTLSEANKRYLADNLIGFFRRDYRRVAEAYIEAGWAPETTSVEEFESAIRSICEQIFDRPLKQISFARFLLQLFQISREFNIKIQPELILLQKTLLQVEGLGRQLEPDLDLWKTAKPFLEQWMSEQMGWRSLVDSCGREVVYWGRILPQFPRLMHQTLIRLSHDQTPSNHVVKAGIPRVLVYVFCVSLLCVLMVIAWALCRLVLG